jgi:hypothetical protein
MKTLLNDRFAPVTHVWGFLEHPKVQLTERFSTWLQSRTSHTTCESGDTTLPTALRKLEPLNTPRTLLMSTDSDWCAVFISGYGGPQSAIGYMSQSIPCRGVLVHCIRNTYDENTHSGKLGSLQFNLYSKEPQEFLNCERSIALINEGRRWRFVADGRVQPYEQLHLYLTPRIRDRFSDTVLESYCASLGIRLFDEDYYGPHYALWYSKASIPVSSLPRTYEDAQKSLMPKL